MTICELALFNVTWNIIVVVVFFGGLFTLGLSIEIVGLIGTLVELDAEQLLEFVTVRLSVTEPLAPAVYVTVGPVCPAVIVPLTIDHE